MATPAFLRALVELSTCETVDGLIDAAFALLVHELHVRGRIEVWDGDDTHVTRGEQVDERAAALDAAEEAYSWVSSPLVRTHP